ncbi:MAG: response regulator transcription factor [Pedococcus sp.]
MIKVLVVDDSTPVRLGLLTLFRAQRDIEVCGGAADGPEGVRMAQQTSPDVVVMDLSMPGLDGFEATRQIVRTSPRTRVVVLTGWSRSMAERAAFLAGADQFVLKGDPPDSLLAAVRAGAPTA